MHGCFDLTTISIFGYGGVILSGPVTLGEYCVFGRTRPTFSLIDLGSGLSARVTGRKHRRLLRIFLLLHMDFYRDVHSRTQHIPERDTWKIAYVSGAQHDSANRALAVARMQGTVKMPGQRKNMIHLIQLVYGGCLRAGFPVSLQHSGVRFVMGAYSEKPTEQVPCFSRACVSEYLQDGKEET